MRNERGYKKSTFFERCEWKLCWVSNQKQELLHLKTWKKTPETPPSLHTACFELRSNSRWIDAVWSKVSDKKRTQPLKLSRFKNSGKYYLDQKEITFFTSQKLWANLFEASRHEYSPATSRIRVGWTQSNRHTRKKPCFNDEEKHKKFSNRNSKMFFEEDGQNRPSQLLGTNSKYCAVEKARDERNQRSTKTFSTNNASQKIIDFSFTSQKISPQN